MLFNSVAFIFFFIIVHLVFWALKGSVRKYWLLLSSIVFYGFWSIPFLIHFLSVVVLAYGFLKLLEKDRKALWLATIISLLLLNLIFFKYTNSVLTILGEEFNIPSALLIKKDLGLVLPLAISFYSFQIIAFLVDYWRGQIKELNFINFSVFILFFPQLIAGPIMRHHEFLDQLDRPHLEQGDVARGMYRILLGTVKKVLVADQIGAIINPLWASLLEPGAAPLDTVTALVCALGFVAQIYCDFSGYTDMARGMALLLGYKIPENFFAPYLATSFTDLWRRWHVTLATWLRDYLYFPLGGSKVGPIRLYANIFIVMCLGGLWHGNSYNFFFWGFWSGLCLIAEKLTRLDGEPQTRLNAILRNQYVMLSWTIGAIFFRAPDIQSVVGIWEGFFNFEPILKRTLELEEIQVFQYYFIGLGLQALRKYKKHYLNFFIKHGQWIIPLATILIFYLIARIEKPAAEFYYFQF